MMAGARGPPPPPPLHHGSPHQIAPEIITIEDPSDGFDLDDRQPQRPQMRSSPKPQSKRSSPIMMSGPPRAMPQFTQTVQGMNGFGAQRVSDIRPAQQLTEAFARHKLTVYEVYTLRKADPLPAFKEFQEERRDSRGNKRILKPKPNWQRVIITKDAFDQEDIVKKIRSLDRHGRSVTTKKKDLAPNQHTQVTKLLDEKNGTEFDPSFGWTLVQLETKIVTNRITGLKETETMTLYLKRAPHQSVDALLMYHKIEQAKMMANLPQKMGNPGMGGPMGGVKGGHIGPPKGAMGGGGKVGFGLGGIGKGKKSFDPIVEVIDNGRRASKSPHFSKSPMRGSFGGKKKFHRDSDTSESSLSDSDSDRTFTSDTETTLSSRSGRRRRESSYLRRDREPSRHHEKDYVMVPHNRRRPSLVYAPEVPRSVRAPSYERRSIDASVADAFAAGVVAATKVAVADRDRAPLSPGLSSPRAIVYPRGSAHGSFDDMGIRDLRIHDDFDDLSSRDYPEYREDIFSDDLRREDRLRRDEIRVLEAEERLRRDSMSISPRTRYGPAVDLRRVSQLPLDGDRLFNYTRNPMMPDIRRRDSMRERYDRMDYPRHR